MLLIKKSFFSVSRNYMLLLQKMDLATFKKKIICNNATSEATGRKYLTENTLLF